MAIVSEHRTTALAIGAGIALALGAAAAAASRTAKAVPLPKPRPYTVVTGPAVSAALPKIAPAAAKPAA
ncbi:MAG: hypothetical protein K8H87_04725, partial [Pseudorhodoplanes sp.]|nr:hypothetical protein [Pseudorhodoplanes sp.]